MNQIELEKIADFFDKDHSGTIDLSEILRVLKGNRRGKYVVQEALSDAEKIENEVYIKKNFKSFQNLFTVNLTNFPQIQLQISKCTCSKKFCVTRVAEGQYRVSRDFPLASPLPPSLSCAFSSLTVLLFSLSCSLVTPRSCVWSASCVAP